MQKYLIRPDMRLNVEGIFIELHFTHLPPDPHLVWVPEAS